MILVSITPLILITALIGFRFETSYRDKVMEHLKEVVVKHQQNINMFLEEKLDYVENVAISYSFQQLTDEAFLQKKLSALQEAYGGVFVDLGVVNEQGIQIAYAGIYKLERADYSQAQWFRQAIERDHFISDVFLGLRRFPHFIVTVRRQVDGMNYILRATIDFESFNSLVENIRIGETGLAFIMNRAGEFQTTPRTDAPVDKAFFLSLVEKKFPLGKTEDKRTAYGEIKDNLKAKESALDKEVLAGQTHFSGRDYVYVVTPLKSAEWILVYQQDTADAFADLRRSRILALAIFLIGTLGIAFTTLVLARKMVGRIERADMEKEMMNEQVIETGKLASVGELAAGIAHEINNPVAIMIEEAGWIGDLVAEETNMESERAQEINRALKQIETQGERCKEITHKLLSFARRTDPRMMEVDVNELIEEILSISEQRSKFSNVKLVKNLQPDLPTIFASPSELQQVLLNLVNNALDAMGSEGGTIEVSTRVKEDHIVVDVADTGQGIPKAILPRIFDPFFTTKPVGKGTGLGLSICFGIVKKMGGSISVNSAVGVGTTMHVHLPLPKNRQKT